MDKLAAFGHFGPHFNLATLPLDQAKTMTSMGKQTKLISNTENGFFQQQQTVAFVLAASNRVLLDLILYHLLQDATPTTNHPGLTHRMTILFFTETPSKSVRGKTTFHARVKTYWPWGIGAITLVPANRFVLTRGCRSSNDVLKTQYL